MGSKDNRARRAAKQRRREQAPRPASARHSSSDPRFTGVEQIALALAAAARGVLAGDGRIAEETALLALRTLEPARAQRLLVDLLADAMTHTWRGGWQPVDLAEVALRRRGKDHAGLLGAVSAHALRPFATQTVHPDWLVQVDDAPTWPADGNAVEAWRQRARKDVVLSLVVAVECMAVLMDLPKLQVLLPLPGTYRPGSGFAQHGDPKVLARVRALLAKAEATDFEPEAEALSAKAQELMTRYSLDRIAVETPASEAGASAARRLWLESPYVQPKAILVSAVASANRCAAVWTEELGFVTVIGDDEDVAVVELMVTSLLLQASRAMLRTSQRSDQKRSFRQSFLVAYASRIGERLREADEQVTSEVMTRELVPALAAHRERVERARDEIFPSTRARSVSVSNAQGYAAGRAAADLAQLQPSARLMP
jgi:hypothetical protein